MKEERRKNWISFSTNGLRYVMLSKWGHHQLLRKTDKKPFAKPIWKDDASKYYLLIVKYVHLLKFLKIECPEILLTSEFFFVSLFTAVAFLVLLVTFNSWWWSGFCGRTFITLERLSKESTPVGMLLVAALVFFLAVAYSCQWFCKGGFLLKVKVSLQIFFKVTHIKVLHKCYIFIRNCNVIGKQ